MSGGTRSYEMARRLVNAGHEVHVVTSLREGGVTTRWQESTEAGIQVHWLNVHYRNDMGFGARMAAFFRFACFAGRRAAQIGGDVVFATSTPLTIALPGVFAARKLNIPLVFEVRDLWPEMPIAMGVLRSPFTIVPARWLEKFAYRNSRRIIALSPGMADGVASVGYPRERVCVIPNSCDVELFDVPAPVGESFLDAHPHLKGGPRVIYGGTFGRVNGLDYLVDIAKAMLVVNPAVRFLAVGDGALKAQVVEHARSCGVLERNFWLLPPLPKSDMPALLSAATIATSFCINLEATWKNSANKFFDALAAARPVAINHEGWQADILRETGAGFVMPPADARSAAEQLNSYLCDRQWLDRASVASAHLARARFGRDDLARSLLVTLEDAVREHRSATHC